MVHIAGAERAGLRADLLINQALHLDEGQPPGGRPDEPARLLRLHAAGERVLHRPRRAQATAHGPHPALAGRHGQHRPRDRHYGLYLARRRALAAPEDPGRRRQGAHGRQFQHRRLHR